MNATPHTAKKGSAPARQRNRRGEGTRLRAQLIDAATDILAASPGPEVLTLREVARRVGVSPASIYRHFADIDALTETIVEQRFTDLTELTDTMVSAQGTPRARLIARCWAYVVWGLRFPGHYRVVFGGRARGTGTLPDGNQGDSLLAALSRDLAAAIPGSDDAKHWDTASAEFDGILLWTALHGIVSLINDKFDMTLPHPADLTAHTVALHLAVNPEEIRTTILWLDRSAQAAD